MTEIFVRAFVPKINRKKEKEDDKYNPNILVIFDTETTNTKEQNLLFGTCVIVKNGKEEWYIFYGDISENDKKILEQKAKEHGFKLITAKEFVRLLYLYGYYFRGKIIGFNLPFDISRLIIKYEYDSESFTLYLNEKLPPIKIKALDKKRAFIRFKRKNKYETYSGYFLDLKTFTFVLTDHSHSLESAGYSFGCKNVKEHVEEHGKITPEYVEYNINDVRLTKELYEKALERYKMFNLDVEPNKLYSPASLGKAYLRKMGLKPFLEQNPHFPLEIIGYIMSTYFGGRTECHFRHKPVKVTYLDFTSMYPSVYALLGLDNYLKSEKIEWKENTENVKEFVENVTIEQLLDKETWKKDVMHSIVLVEPNDDILPVRTRESKADNQNISLNYVTSTTPLWYTIQDVISSKLLTGKTPKILKAITFYAIGRQNLREIEIAGVKIKPEEDFIKTMIEKRQEFKANKSQINKKLKECKDEKERQKLQLEKEVLDQKQLILKIIANATSYGILIELNPKKLKEETVVKVYSNKVFESKVNTVEELGEYFNPLLATLITGSARLILAMVEKIVKDNKGYIAYMDTDSVFVSPQHAKLIQDMFRKLNPYSNVSDMFKVEDGELEDGKEIPLNDVWFYGISSKRYCLYIERENNKKEIVKYSSHGIGQYKGIDSKKIWYAILNDDYSEFSDIYARMELSLTKPEIFKRMEKLNEGKPIEQQIKPFGFVTVGSQIDGVIPLIPYTKENWKITNQEFVDYKSGKTYSELNTEKERSYYWKKFDEILRHYYIHNDRKFNYKNGIAERKHIIVDKITYIGKETRNLEEAEVLGANEFPITEYKDHDKFVEWVASLPLSKVKEWNIPITSFKELKKKLLAGKKVRSKYLRVLIEKFENIS